MTKVKIPSGSPRDKTVPTHKQFYKVNPEACTKLMTKLKKAGFSHEQCQTSLKDFVFKAKRGIIN